MQGRGRVGAHLGVRRLLDALARDHLLEARQVRRGQPTHEMELLAVHAHAREQRAVELQTVAQLCDRRLQL